MAAKETGRRNEPVLRTGAPDHNGMVFVEVEGELNEGCAELWDELLRSITDEEGVAGPHDRPPRLLGYQHGLPGRLADRCRDTERPRRAWHSPSGVWRFGG